jgi:nucleoside-diphosphate-sugar epimerase
MTKALVVGGTGPTGPLIVQGLIERGFEVTVYHRGLHETDDLPQVHQHLHGDPFTKEALEQDLGGQSWDLVVSMYGRLRLVADVMAGSTRKFVGAGGPSFMLPEHLPYPRGLELPLPEDHPTYTDRSLSEYRSAIAYTERQVMEHHAKGDFAATVLRYTSIYGPRAPRQWVWSIVRRVLDGRRQMVVPGDGSQMRQTCYAENAAHQLLLACDKDEANGHVFNSVDERSFTVRDMIGIVAGALESEMEVVGVSHSLASDLAAGYAPRRTTQLDVFSLKALLGYRDPVSPDEGMRRAARWLVDNWDSIDHEEVQRLLGDPLDYDAEDRLIASAKEWQQTVSESISKPQERGSTGGNWMQSSGPRTG